MGKDLIHLMLDLVVWGEKHLGEWVKMPAEKLAFIKQSPEAFKAAVLKEMEAWEAEYLL